MLPPVEKLTIILDPDAEFWADPGSECCVCEQENAECELTGQLSDGTTARLGFVCGDCFKAMKRGPKGLKRHLAKRAALWRAEAERLEAAAADVPLKAEYLLVDKRKKK
jgi:hypothetical protein